MERTYLNATSSQRPLGMTKQDALHQFLELRSPLWGNRYIDDRTVDLVHRVNEDPRLLLKGRNYPKNTQSPQLNFSRVTRMDESGFNEHLGPFENPQLANKTRNSDTLNESLRTGGQQQQIGYSQPQVYRELKETRYNSSNYNDMSLGHYSTQPGSLTAAKCSKQQASMIRNAISSERSNRINYTQRYTFNAMAKAGAKRVSNTSATTR